MKFTRKFAKRALQSTAAPAVNPSCGGFTLLEVMVVIVIIGILAGLAYSSLIDLVFANRAKESAQVMRSFAERAMAEAKRQERPIKLELDNNRITATFAAFEGENSPAMSELLSDGFAPEDNVPNCIDDKYLVNALVSFNEGAISTPKIGISSIAAGEDYNAPGEDNEGYFVACGARGYCAAAVKAGKKNAFVACVKKGNSANWEAL